jgi:hypothetical protein
MSATPWTSKNSYSTLERLILRLLFAGWLGFWYCWEMQNTCNIVRPQVPFQTSGPQYKILGPSILYQLHTVLLALMVLQKWCVMLCIHSLAPWNRMTQDHCECHSKIIIIVDNRFCQNWSSCGEVSDGIERFVVWVQVLRSFPCCICYSFLFSHVLYVTELFLTPMTYLVT